jgi:hypothetical protein
MEAVRESVVAFETVARSAICSNPVTNPCTYGESENVAGMWPSSPPAAANAASKYGPIAQHALVATLGSGAVKSVPSV